MHILLANDDGIDSAGLHALIREAVGRGHKITVCAPNRQQSAVGQALTFFRPIAVTPADFPGAVAYAVDGTPADCVRLGLFSLAEEPADLVISGINDGLNSGNAIYVSGTVGAAREAALSGVKAMAVSIDRPADGQMLARLAKTALEMGERLFAFDAPPGSVLNLNAPALPEDRLLPPVMAPVNHGRFMNFYERRQNPWGGTYFWAMPQHEREDATPGSDEYFLQKGHMTCTFLMHSAENTGNCLEFLQDE